MIFFVKKEKTTLNINRYKDSQIKVTHTELQAWTGWTMRCQISRQSKPSWMTKIRTTSLQPQCGQNEKYKNTMNNNTHEINTTKIQKSRPQAPNLSALRMRQVITKTPNPFITICSNRRIESRKLNWKAESKLDTKNSEYIKMLGQSVEEGLDKKAKVGSWHSKSLSSEYEVRIDCSFLLLFRCGILLSMIFPLNLLHIMLKMSCCLPRHC